MPTPTDIKSTARRLRYLRRHPVEPCGKTYSQAEREAAAFAYEYALRVMIDEFSARDDAAALIYGPQGEDAELGYPG